MGYVVQWRVICNADVGAHSTRTRAKGWRFELDHERIEQSDTWTLAPPEVRPWLLMLWLTAWRQEPCGSLSNSDELIAARIGIPMKTFNKHRAVLMRGWWLAEDGRLYHDTVTKRVLEMIAAGDRDRTRKAAYLGRMDAKRTVASQGVPDLSRATDAGQTGDSRGSDPGRDDHGTRTGTSTSKEEIPPTTRSTSESVGGDRQSPTKAGEVCRAIRAKGVSGANPSNPELLAFIGKGVPVETFEAAAVCVKAKPPKGMAYLLGIVRRQLDEAAAIEAGPGVKGKPWDTDRSTIEAKATELGLKPWNEADLSVDRETFETEDDLRMWLLVGAGYCHFIPGTDGQLVAVPQSMDWVTLEEADFLEVHRRVDAFMWEPRARRVLWPHLGDERSYWAVDCWRLEFEKR